MSITKEQFEEWKTHPVTLEVYKEINFVKEALERDLGSGITVSNENSDITKDVND